jgi:hypothetical protein
MISSKSLGFSFTALAAALTLSACGGSTAPAESTATIGAAGGTVRAGSAALSLPAGSLPSDVQITLRVSDDAGAGRVARIEVEPAGLALAIPALLAFQVDDSNVRVRVIHVEAEAEHLGRVELEDRLHHRWKTSLDRLGHLEIEVEHARACSVACGAGLECDDGVCKPHGGDDDGVGATCDTVCGAGLECEHGTCQPHGGGADDGLGGAACSVACASGLECEHGACVPHGGR